jgi:hypothetical protein
MKGCDGLPTGYVKIGRGSTMWMYGMQLSEYEEAPEASLGMVRRECGF